MIFKKNNLAFIFFNIRAERFTIVNRVHKIVNRVHNCEPLRPTTKQGESLTGISKDYFLYFVQKSERLTLSI